MYCVAMILVLVMCYARVCLCPQGPFMELLRRQHLDACLARCEQMTDCILEVAHDRALEAKGCMNADDLQTALSR